MNLIELRISEQLLKSEIEEYSEKKNELERDIEYLEDEILSYETIIYEYGEAIDQKNELLNGMQDDIELLQSKEKELNHNKQINF